jgi:hypothetical protein
MKPLILLLIAAFSLAMSSCARDYFCECTYSSPSNGVSSVKEGSYSIHSKKSVATAQCKSSAYATAQETLSCVLK